MIKEKVTKVKLSAGSGKLEYVVSINSSPLNNPFCLKMAESNTVCAACYSIKSLKTYRKNCNKPWAANGELLSAGPITKEQMPIINTTVCRIHSHGEILNRQHAENIITIAKAHPDTRFSWFTKRIDLIKGLKIPKNVIMVYSNPKVDEVMQTPPAGFDKVFNVVSEDSDEKINCGARSCFKCQCCFKKKTAKCVIERIK